MHDHATLYEPFEVIALVNAAERADWQAIDAITDRLAEQGLCRPRSDDSRMIEWAAMRRRPIQPESAEDAGYVAIEVRTTSDASIGSQIAQQLRGVFAGAA